MESSKSGYLYLDLITKYWTIIGFILTGIFYIIGYLKAYYLLRMFRIYVTPTEIYSVISLFVSGASTILLAGVIPCITILTAFFIVKKKSPVVLCIVYSALIFFPLFFGTFREGFPILININSAGVKSFSVIVMYLINLYFILSMIYYGINVIQNKKTNAYVFYIAMWFMLFISSYIHVLDNIQFGTPIGSISHDAGLGGSIVTEYPLSTFSEVAELNNKIFYKTSGILLSKNEQTYYFIPGIFAQTSHDNFPDTKLVIIPSSRVWEFYNFR